MQQHHIFEWPLVHLKVLAAVSKPKLMGTYSFLRSPSMVLGQPFTWHREDRQGGGNRASSDKTPRYNITRDQNPILLGCLRQGGLTNPHPPIELKSPIFNKRVLGCLVSVSDLPPTHLGLAAARLEVFGEDGRVGVGVVPADHDQTVKVELLYHLDDETTGKERRFDSIEILGRTHNTPLLYGIQLKAHGVPSMMWGCSIFDLVITFQRIGRDSG